MSNKKTVGANIQYFRKAAKIKQDAMADALGISTASLSMYENGKRFPNSALLEKIAQVLQVKVSDLYKEKELPSIESHGSSRIAEDDNLVSHIAIREQLVAFRSVLEAARNLYPDETHGPLLEVFKNYEAMLSLLEESANTIHNLGIKLQHTTEMLYNWTRKK